MELRKDPFEVPFGHSTIVKSEEFSIENLPDFEIRVRNVRTGEEKSIYFKFDPLLKPQEQKLVAMDQLEETYNKWLELKFKGNIPVDYEDWGKLAKKLVEFFFVYRLSIDKPLVARGSGIYLSRWGYSEEDAPELSVMIAKGLTFRSGAGNHAWIYDRWIEKGAIGGFVNVFGERHVMVIEHAYLNLRRLFSSETIAVYAIKRLNEKLPGIVDKKLVTDFQWLHEGEYFGGAMPAKNPHKR